MTTERIEYDLVLVGGSPSNFALAHRLVQLAKDSGVSFSLAILEKSKEFGGHIMSGAVSNPHVIQKLFPNYKESGFPIEGVCTSSDFKVLGEKHTWDVPRLAQPEGLHKEGYLILSLSHVVYWMANQLKEVAKEAPNVTVDLFPGFAAHKVIFEGIDASKRVAGVQVVETLDPANPDEGIVYGKVTAFGDKGFVSQDVMAEFSLRDNPQVWSVGVKETWQLAEGVPSLEGKVWHTMGYPLVDGSFGGGFIYGMKDNKLTIGLVISLDSPNPNVNPQQRLQDLKAQPWVAKMIDGGKLLKYGAALLPEGGYYSLPTKFAVNGGLFLGDALGVLNVSTLAGIDKAMESGYQAAELIHTILKSGGAFTEDALASYQTTLMSGFIGKDLKAGRYFRHAWLENPKLLNDYLPKVLAGIDSGNWLSGFLKIGLKNPFGAIGDAIRLKGLMDGIIDIGPITYKKDAQHIVPGYKPATPFPNVGKRSGASLPKSYFSREDAVFYANPKYHEGNEHIDEFKADTCVTCIAKYDGYGQETPCVSDCTAEVHRVDVVGDLRKHGMSLENCVQCRTCEFVCPEENLRVHASAQSSGPDFMGL
jgi:electron-transferring-flavoprotein dehydrogenase